MKDAVKRGKNSEFGDEKMIAQIWVHEREYSPKVPQENSHEKAISLVQQKEKQLGLPTDQ